jgi:hypothetical protein
VEKYRPLPRICMIDLGESFFVHPPTTFVHIGCCSATF